MESLDVINHREIIEQYISIPDALGIIDHIVILPLRKYKANEVIYEYEVNIKHVQGTFLYVLQIYIENNIITHEHRQTKTLLLSK